MERWSDVSDGFPIRKPAQIRNTLNMDKRGGSAGAIRPEQTGLDAIVRPRSARPPIPLVCKTAFVRISDCATAVAGGDSGAWDT
jgi:hypothetical protein